MRKPSGVMQGLRSYQPTIGMRDRYGSEGQSAPSSAGAAVDIAVNAAVNAEVNAALDVVMLQ